MSIPIMDYLPFDYMRYAEEVLPLWRDALQGNIEPLKNLIETAPHFSLWPYLQCALAPSPLDIERMYRFIVRDAPDFDHFLPSLSRITHLWSLLEPALQWLDQQSITDPHWNMVAMFHAALVYTFCSALPPQDTSAFRRTNDGSESRQLHYAPRIGNEDIPLWEEYTCRNKQAKYQWKQFYQPLPADVSSEIVADQGKVGQMYTAETRKRNPRALFTYFRYANPSGFLTSGETKRLLHEYQRHASPSLPSIRDFCLRDAADQEFTFDWSDIKKIAPSFPPVRALTMDLYYSLDTQGNEGKEVERQLYEALCKAHPDQMQQFAQKYYERVWRLEEEMMERVAYAVSQNWGFMVIYE